MMKPTGKISLASIARRPILYSVFCSVRDSLAVLTLLLLAQVALSAPAQAQAPGDLDPTFGIGGKVTTDFFGGEDAGLSLALQSDGKIVLAGAAFNPATGDDFALARYNADGTLDTDFGSSGLVTTDFFGRIRRQMGFETDLAFQVLLQPDGKIVLAGWASDEATGFHAALARYNADGSLDTGFGSDGRVIGNFPGKFDSALAAALQPDGKIVVAGTFGHAVAGGNDVDFALARYNEDGTPDDTFGNGGLVTTDFFRGVDEARAVAVQPDGRIVVAGFAARPGSMPRDFALARYNADGSLDPDFGSSGLVTTDFAGGDDFARAVALELKKGKVHKIVAAGHATDPATGRDFALARYNADGSLDPDFGSSGLVTTDFFGEEDRVFGMALQRGGKIIAAGRAFNSVTGNFDFALARYNADGSLDSSFGSGGKITTDFTGGFDWAFAVALQRDGNIVVGGLATDPATSVNFALARYVGD